MNGMARIKGIGRVICVTLVLATAGVFSCAEKEEPPEIIRPVRYQQVFSTGGKRTRTFSGVLRAGLESKLSFKVPGTIERVAVKVGDRVDAGQLIAELDSSDYELQREQAQASLNQAVAQARNADANYERVRALYETKNASRNDLDAARAASESANAAVESARKQLELAGLQVSYTRLTAPVSGAIAEVPVEINENVQAGNTVAVLTSGSRLEVHVSIPGSLISRLEEGDRVVVSFDALPDRSCPATITEVGVASMGMATTFPVTVRLDEREEEVRPGMVASVAFRFDSGDERIRFLVPPSAVGEDRNGRYVFTVEPDPDDVSYGVAHRRAVTIGDLTPEGLEIFEGLTDGDILVTAGISRIDDGQRVKL